MPQKSAAYYRFCQDRASGKFSYYDPEEIDQIACELLDDGNIDDAQYVAEMGLKQHPDDENTNKLVIWIYIHNHRVEEAERMFERFRNDGTDSTCRLNFCLQVLNGHPKQALKDFTAKVTNGLISASDWINTIEEMAEAIPRDILLQYLLKVSETKNMNAETIGRIAAKVMDCGNLEKAVPLLNRSLDLDAYDIYTWQDLARCYFELQDLSKAAEACDYGLAIDEKNALLNFTRGYIHYTNQEWKESIRHLEIARKFAEGKIMAEGLNLSDDQIQQQISVTYGMLAFSYAQVGENDKAEECFAILNEREPSNPEHLVQMATVFLTSGNLPKAIATARKASDMDPDNTEIRALLVSIYTTMHKFTDAIAELETIMKIKPRNKNFIIAYAELQLHLGNNEAADKAYRKLLTLKPRDKSTRTLLREYFTSIGDMDALDTLDNK